MIRNRAATAAEAAAAAAAAAAAECQWYLVIRSMSTRLRSD